MTDAQRAAFRILCDTPEDRIRKHEWTPIEKSVGRRRSPAEMEAIRKRLLELEARGFTRREMRADCKCNNQTVIKFLGRLPNQGRPKKHK